MKCGIVEYSDYRKSIYIFENLKSQLGAHGEWGGGQVFNGEVGFAPVPPHSSRTPWSRDYWCLCFVSAWYHINRSDATWRISISLQERKNNWYQIFVSKENKKEGNDFIKENVAGK